MADREQLSSFGGNQSLFSDYYLRERLSEGTGTVHYDPKELS